MHPNQQPNYPGGAPNQGYPPGQFPHYPVYQAGVPHQYMPQNTPQYPQPGGGGGGGTIPPFMIKQEPAWSQDGRYGMPPGPSGGMQGGMQGNYGYHGMEMGGDPRNPVTIYSPGGPHHQSTSLLAQHLSSAPVPPPQQSQQPSHLSQLLQQPVYPGPTQMQQQMMEQRMAQMQAMRQQQLYQQQQEYIAQQQTRAAQLQAEQQAAAMAAATAAASNTSLAPPQAQGFPPSASSSHSAYSSQMRPHEQALVNQQMALAQIRPSPHQKEVDLEKFTTGELCQYGRELVNELNGKTSQLSFMLKKVMERKILSTGENPNELAEHCRFNLQRMSDIRQVIEKRREPEWKRMSGDEYIELMLDDSELKKEISEERLEKRADLEKRFPCILSKTPPNEGDVWYQGRWISAALHKKYMKFEANKELLTSLASQLKSLSWKIDVTSPAHLKKVDQTKISKKRNEDATA